MPALPSTDVERGPLAIPVKRYTVLALVEVVEFLEVVVLNCSRAIFVEQAESDLIFCVWFCKKVFKVSPVVKGEFPGFSSVSNAI